MRKIIITNGCDPRETAWQRVLELTTPRFKQYAERHGYDFRMIWYQDIDHSLFPEFKNPGPFIGDAASRGSRLDFILWKYDRSILAPNWLRYAAVLQLLDEYDLVVYLDGDVVIMDRDVDVADEIPPQCWIAAPINGPSPDNAGPGGPMWAVRRCPESLEFLRKNWEGQLWKAHPNWTDGVDFMHMLGYTITEPVRKERVTEYDSAFWALPRRWMAWHPDAGSFVHIGGGSGGPERKAEIIRRMGVGP